MGTGETDAGTGFRPAPGTVPRHAGVYRFWGADGAVVYVGKARNLRSRLASYFADPDGLHPRTAAMVAAAANVDWVTVSNEVEALQLEYSWIKEYEPRFNIRYRDDKSYPYLAVTLNEQYPRVLVMRGAKRKGVRYFGPYAHAWAIRETVDQLLRAFPMRSCSTGVFKRHGLLGRPCLLGDIGKCSGPCVGRISEEDHRAIAEDLCAFLAGGTDRFLRRVEEEMKAAASGQEYERAAKLRDDLGALRRALERSAVVLPDRTDVDVIAVAGDGLESAVQVFSVRGGRIRGQRDFVIERPVDVGADEVLEQLLMHLYGEAEPAALPGELLVEQHPAHQTGLAGWLARQRGRPVAIRVPRRGAKRDLLSTVRVNAEQSLALHKARRGRDLVSRGKAMTQLQEQLGLPEAPLRIECIDVSNQSGRDVVASVVVFDDGLPRVSEYRRYAISGVSDDVASVRQAVVRRYRDRSENRRYSPGLLLIDGGSAQVRAAAAALMEVGAQDVPVRGLAKRLEEVWSPGQREPTIMSRRSEGLYLLQRIRDEAHRVAIAHHRARRGKRSRASALDGIPGLGPARRGALLKHFGSVRAVRAASTGEIAAVPGIGPRLAEAIASSLGAEQAPGGVNMATGEIVEHARGRG